VEQIVKHPIPEEEIYRLKTTVKDQGRYAFIYGHGLWSDLDLHKTLNWLDEVLDATAGPWPRLFVTPNAAGKEKADDWIVSQGNKALILFEEAIGVEAQKRGIDHLGTWNMSIQSNKYDGVHLDMRGNLVKAMMVINWLNMLQ
jgi:hypothetical protein